MKRQWDLDNSSIEECLSALQKELVRIGVSRHDMLRLSLSVEEILLGYRDHQGEAAKFTISVKKKSGTVLTDVYVPGESLDLIGYPESMISIKVVHNWAGSPSWEYTKGANQI